MSKKVLTVLTVIFIVIVVAGVVVLAVLHFRGNKTNGLPVPEDVGEIYYQETPEEHIAETDAGIKYADNELLVVANDGINKAEMEALARKYGAKIVGYIEATGDYQWSFNNVYMMSEMEDLITAITSEDQILEASPNYIFDVCENSVDHDINTGKKWKGDLNISTDNKGKSWGVEAINAPAAWALMDENKEKIDPVCVGVIDDGFDNTHEDLPFLKVFYNEKYENAKKSKKKGIGRHGTHVAGIFAADGTNDKGICGVYPYAQEGGLYGVSRKNKEQYSENLSDKTRSLVWEKICFAELILRNVKVINCSYGYETIGPELEYYRDVLHDDTKVSNLETWFSCIGEEIGGYLERFLKKGYDFLVVVAAGNESNKKHKLKIEKGETAYKVTYKSGDIPARGGSSLTCVTSEKNALAYARIIVVGAINKKFERRKDSNIGGDIYAPGTDIYSTVPVNNYENGEVWSGTSMAAPHVAGVAASVWSINKNLKGDEVKEIVINSFYEKNGLKIVDMVSAVNDAFESKNGDEKAEEPAAPTDGVIMGFVVDKDDLQVDANEGITSGRIPYAKVTATNIETNQPDEAITDQIGHFELILPPGEYTLAVTAEGYEPYRCSGTFRVEAGQVNYLKQSDGKLVDWIKMTKLKEPPGSDGSESLPSYTADLNRDGKNETLRFDLRKNSNGSICGFVLSYHSADGRKLDSFDLKKIYDLYEASKDDDNDLFNSGFLANCSNRDLNNVWQCIRVCVNDQGFISVNYYENMVEGAGCNYMIFKIQNEKIVVAQHLYHGGGTDSESLYEAKTKKCLYCFEPGYVNGKEVGPDFDYGAYDVKGEYLSALNKAMKSYGYVFENDDYNKDGDIRGYVVENKTTKRVFEAKFSGAGTKESTTAKTEPATRVEKTTAAQKISEKKARELAIQFFSDKYGEDAGPFSATCETKIRDGKEYYYVHVKVRMYNDFDEEGNGIGDSWWTTWGYVFVSLDGTEVFEE